MSKTVTVMEWTIAGNPVTGRRILTRAQVLGNLTFMASFPRTTSLKVGQSTRYYAHTPGQWVGEPQDLTGTLVR